jgi:hypothetical protein
VKNSLVARKGYCIGMGRARAVAGELVCVSNVYILYELFVHILFLTYLRYRTVSALAVSLVDPLSPP